jgi:hypothetical protein
VRDLRLVGNGVPACVGFCMTYLYLVDNKGFSMDVAILGKVPPPPTYRVPVYEPARFDWDDWKTTMAEAKPSDPMYIGRSRPAQSSYVAFYRTGETTERNGQTAHVYRQDES